MSDSNGNLVPPLGHPGPTSDVTTSDGSEIRLLVDARHGATKSSLVEVTLGPGQVARTVRHRSVEAVPVEQGGLGEATV